MNNGEEFRRPNVNDIGMLQNNFRVAYRRLYTIDTRR